MVEVLKVSSKSNPSSVAGALAGVVRTAGEVEMQVVGAGALNQAVKAVAIARGYVAAAGFDLACRPAFADIQIDGEDRTALRLLIEACQRGPLPHLLPHPQPPARYGAPDPGSGDASPDGRLAASASDAEPV